MCVVVVIAVRSLQAASLPIFGTPREYLIVRGSHVITWDACVTGAMCLKTRHAA